MRPPAEMTAHCYIGLGSHNLYWGKPHPQPRLICREKHFFGMNSYKP